MARTFFAYHISHIYGDFSLRSYHTDSTKPREGDIVYVVSGNHCGTDSGVDYWLEGIFRIDRRESGPHRLPTKGGGLKSFEFQLSLSAVRVPDARIPLMKASWYKRKEIHDYFSSGQNFNPLPTEPDYKTRFDELLAEYGLARESELDEDLTEIRRTIPSATERDALIKARIGQGRFRADIARLWRTGEACALTSHDIPELLVASHIRPWRDSNNEERLDPCNGILLVAHADRLFDRYLMSFRESGGDFEAVIHPRVRAAASSLGLKEGMALRTSQLGPTDYRKFGQYMAEHYAEFHRRLQNDVPVGNK